MLKDNRAEIVKTFKKLEQNQCSNDATNCYKKMIERVQEMCESANTLITNRTGRTKLNENIAFMSELSTAFARVLQQYKQSQKQTQNQLNSNKRKSNPVNSEVERSKKTKIEDPRKTLSSQILKNSEKTVSPLILPANKLVAYKVNKDSDDDERSGYECDDSSSEIDSNSDNEN